MRSGSVPGCGRHQRNAPWADLVNRVQAQRLHLYTPQLYETLERETSQSIGYHPTGGLHLAGSNEEIDTLTVLRAPGVYKI